MPSIGVLEAFQKATDKPTRRIKRSGGHSLVRQGLAVWITANVLLQMRARTNRSTPRQIEGNPSQPYAKCRARYIQHHIEPKLYKVNRRQMEELERWYASVSGDSL